MDNSKPEPQILLRQLRPLRRRMRGILIGRAVIWSLVVCGLGFAIVSFIGRVLGSGASASSWVSWTVIAAGLATLVGTIIGLVHALPWQAVARKMDERFGLHDATLTALQFSQQSAPSDLQRLQVTQTISRIQDIERPDRAATWSNNRLLLGCGAIWTGLFLLALIPSFRQQAFAQQAASSQQRLDDRHRGLAEQLETNLMDELRELAELTGSPGPDVKVPKLTRLRDTAQEQIDRLKQPGLDEREAMATLTRIQDALTEATNELDAASLEKSLDQLGDTFADSEELASIADAIKADAFDQAADQAEQLRPNEIAEEQRRPLADDLDELAKELREEQQEGLSEAVSDLAAGINQDAEAGKRGAESLSEHLRQQMLMMNLQRKLDQKMLQLTAAKSVSQNGGNNTERSERDKETWGKGRTGNPLGDNSEATADTNRRREQLTSVVGEGETETQRVQSEPTTGETTRELQPSFRPYADAMENALQHETIPLGHRSTIRKYFESIRPE